AKERERRYRSAEELGEDIERHFGGRPISAKRDSLWYVMRKTIARRPWLLVGTAAIAVAAVAAVYYEMSATRATALRILTDAERDSRVNPRKALTEFEQAVR